MSEKAARARRRTRSCRGRSSVGRHADDVQAGLLSLHAGDADALRPRYGDRDAARGRPGQRLRPPSPACRGNAPGGARVGARNTLCREAKYYSPTITAVLLPDGHDADQFRDLALNTFNIAYGASFVPAARNTSASAISATSTTPRSSARWGQPGMFAGVAGNASRKAACRRQWTTSCQLDRARPAPPRSDTDHHYSAALTHAALSRRVLKKSFSR